ncbi:MAG: outer membrane protein assembly factor BamA [Spirochaetaceae bacterium]|jgi:outer membrane protein insertion porin family|nr:outer membrane protein assembly factor BamA [Spirochaetaceae bacterium]
MTSLSNRRIARALIAAFLVMGTLAFIAPVHAQENDWNGKIIKNITFTGLRHIRLADLEGITEHYVDKPYSDDLFFELLGNLYELEYFEEIRPYYEAVGADRSGVIVRLAVVERPVLTRILFSGNAGLRRSELLDTITLKLNDVLNTLKIRLDEQAILTKYLEKGYVDAKVRSETQTSKDGSVTLTFIINEGEKVIVDAIRFEGNTVYSERKLRGVLSLKPKGILQDGAFQEAKLIADRQTLMQYYRDRGYIDADLIDVVRDVVHDAKGSSRLTLTFRLREGRIYTFGGIMLSGNTIFTTEELLKLVTSKKNVVVNARKLEMDLQRIADQYYNDGYIFNTIARDEKKEDGVLSYNITIIERNRAHIENVIVRGNKKTRPGVILREMPLEPGDVFSKVKVMEGLRNLYNLQYFSSVIPETPPGSAESLMDLVINVEEQMTTEIQAGITFSGTTDPNALLPFSIMFKWTDRNFLGYGNILGAEINASDTTQNLSLQYTHRWIFGLPLNGGFDLTVQHRQLYALMDNQAPFFYGNEDYAYPDGFASYNDYIANSKLPADEYLMKYEQYSFTLGFSTGYRWLTFLGNLGLGGNIRGGFKINTYDDDLYRPFDPALRERNNELTPITSISTNLYLDNRDIYYDPSRGYYIMNRFGIYGILPGAIEEEHYMRNDLKLEGFVTLWNLPIGDNWAFKGVFGLHTGLSFLFAQPGYGAPIVEDTSKLYIDGMFTGRGWVNERNNRGFALWENWAELRIPIVPGMLALDGFFDIAEVASTPGRIFDFDPIASGDNADGSFAGRLRFSFGGGVRFAIPQFPFRFLFAKRFKIKNGQIEWQRGALGYNPEDPFSGIDFVLSFALSTY